MIYLSGGAPGAVPQSEEWGIMLTPQMGNRLPPGAVWAADNGCFTLGDRFDLGVYLRWLDKRTDDERQFCLFATAPDVPFDAKASSARSIPVLPQIRELGYTVAFVTQDGHTPRDIPWRGIDAIFTGGTTDWKTGEDAVAIRHEAQARGKWTHMGRVNTQRRIALAKAQGYDSCDGTCLKFGSDINAPRLQTALAHPQMGLGRLLV